jgi:hypothetical protein
MLQGRRRFFPLTLAGAYNPEREKFAAGGKKLFPFCFFQRQRLFT